MCVCVCAHVCVCVCVCTYVCVCVCVCVRERERERERECVSINGPFDHTYKCACVMTAQHIIESVDSISRDGLDTSVYVIQNKKPKTQPR